MMRAKRACGALIVGVVAACSNPPTVERDGCAGACEAGRDGATADADDSGAMVGEGGADVVDAAQSDAGAGDAAREDAGLDVSADASEDAGVDVSIDGGMDAGIDAIAEASVDATADATADVLREAAADAAVDVAREAAVDASTGPITGGPCLSGARGATALRFGFEGREGGTPTTRLEVNGLPDRTRWRVTPNDRIIGYRPVFTDTFLGAGGLQFDGTKFIDVELSTAGLSAITSVTLSVFGRSFNTTASGSFRWQTFTAMGAAPTNLVANSAPYRWYGADARASFVVGDSGVLLRIYPGPSSGSLVVNRVELCMEAR
jgi:hypothetical protein